MTAVTLAVPPSPTVAIPADDNLYEIIDGQLMELPPMSAYAARIASRLVVALNIFAKAKDLGEAVGEVLFRLALPVDRNRRPDAAFVSYDRWAKGRPQPEEANAWDVVPDLAIEVISPHDMAEEILEKVEEYFRAGVKLVWLVYPRRRIVHVYESLTQLRGLLRQDELDGGTVLSGFRLPLKELFLEEPPTPSETAGDAVSPGDS